MNEVEVVALSGGIGGAKLAVGLNSILPDRALACIVNTGDDFEHLGLHISPDLDTLLYTLAGCSDPQRGWGRRDETWSFMRALGQIGGQTWFSIGDGDLALHVERTRRLADGESLSSIMADIALRLGVTTLLLPMTEQPVRTRLQTDVGDLEFQDYFVARRAAPAVQAISYEGCSSATTTPAVAGALASGALRAIIVCPSNPYLSIDPILAVPGMRELLRKAGVPVVAVAPLIAGEAVKGPTAKIMRELGIERSPLAVAEHYRGLIDGLVIDHVDRDWCERCGIPMHVTRTLMVSSEDRRELATQTLAFAQSLVHPRQQLIG